MSKSIVAVDLFCSAGGLTKGLIDAGINVKKGFDIDKRAKETYEKNNKGTVYVEKDVCLLSGDEIIEGLDIDNSFLLLAGCAPCQPFSSINLNSNSKDKRKNLILAFARLIRESKPDFVFMENVPGLAGQKGKHIFDEFLKTLSKEGFNYDYDVLNVKKYGVPQNRKRLVLIASKHGPIKIPQGIYGSKEKPFITLKNTISKYPSISAGEKHKFIPNHECRALSPINKERIKHIKKNGGSRNELPAELILECHKKHKGHTDVYGRMRWGDVSPTLTCKCISISNGRFAHPEQDRGISVREAAAIQTFPDDYVFYGNITDTTKWVGNAVPVKFAKVFGEHFIKSSDELD
jgi:DNA (cytosine-5)-methyltransferase 1